MYRAYSLTIPEIHGKNFIGSSTNLIDTNRAKVRRNIKNFFSNGVIDAEALEKEWFGPTTPHIFLSHSHKDVDLAAGFAEMLWAKFGITCFVDSFVWGYCDELLKQIDTKFCKSESGSTFDYARRNRSTSHVHMMLSAALAKVMDRAECIMFLNTPNSIITEDFIQGEKTFTASPWIYNELLLTRLLNPKLPSRILEESVRKSVATEQFPQFQFGMNIDHLINISTAEVNDWLDCGEVGTDALDFLYRVYQ